MGSPLGLWIERENEVINVDFEQVEECCVCFAVVSMEFGQIDVEDSVFQHRVAAEQLVAAEMFGCNVPGSLSCRVKSWLFHQPG